MSGDVDSFNAPCIEFIAEVSNLIEFCKQFWNQYSKKVLYFRVVYRHACIVQETWAFADKPRDAFVQYRCNGVADSWKHHLPYVSPRQIWLF